MKIRNLFYILAAAAMFTVVSCKDEKQPEPTPTPGPEEATLSVAPSSVSYETTGSSKTLTVKSNSDWTVTVAPTSDWLTISPLKGSKDGTVTMTATTNVGLAGAAAEARECVVTVSVEGKKVDVKVSQAAEAIVFVVSGDTAEIPAAGGKVNVSVEYNDSYKTETLPEWITPATKATATDALVFDVAANETFEARQGEIAFKSASGKTGKVTVKQAAAEKPAGKSLKTAQDLKDFAAAVNSGDAAAIAAFDPDGDGIFKLEADIDFGGETIVPVGNGSYANATSYKGASFKKATFDGQNHVIDNYVITEATTANCAVGFFGILDSAVVKNVVVGPKAKVSTAVAEASHAGALVGCAWDSDLENCTNKGSVSATVGLENKRTIIGGVLGVIIAKGKDCNIINCVNEGTLTSTNTVNTKNGATGFHVGGVVGMTDGAATTQDFICKVVNCVNKADITAQATRMAGVVATPNKHSTLSGCVNEGNIVDTDVTASNSRPSGICSTTGANCLIEKCVNKGNVTFGVEGDTTHGFAAGICAQPNSGGKIIECENYGTIRSDIIKATAANKKYIGSIFCHVNKAAGEIRNCKVEGSIGPLVEDDTYKVVKITKDNFMSYITMIPLDDAQNNTGTFEGNYCTVEEAADPDIPGVGYNDPGLTL